MATIVVELIYLLMRRPRNILVADCVAVFLWPDGVARPTCAGLLFPMFYKFEPLENDELKRRLIVLSERAGTRVRGVYRWHLSEKSKKANAALTGLGATAASSSPTPCLTIIRMMKSSGTGARTRPSVHRHILKGILVQAESRCFVSGWRTKCFIMR